MQYLLLIYADETAAPQPGTPEFGPFMQGYQEFTTHLQEKNAFVGGDELQPVATASTVTMENGKMEVTDGPFAETKEQLGGYYLVEAENLDIALEYASKIPSAAHGRVEVRPVVKY